MFNKWRKVEKRFYSFTDMQILVLLSFQWEMWCIQSKYMSKIFLSQRIASTWWTMYWVWILHILVHPVLKIIYWQHYPAEIILFSKICGTCISFFSRSSWNAQTRQLNTFIIYAWIESGILAIFRKNRTSEIKNKFFGQEPGINLI